MLVAGVVDGDSRVQKVAHAAAEAGWDAVLIGKAPGPHRDESRIGRARVIRVPVGDTVTGYERRRLRGGGRVSRAEYSAAQARVRGWDATAGGGPGAAVAAGWWRLLRRRPRLDAAVGALGTGPVGGALALAGTALRGLADPHGGWRAFNPWMRDLELAFAPVIDELDPDLIHAHDFHMIGIGARAAARLSRPERPVRWLYDAHEYLAGIEVPARHDLRRRLRRRMLVGLEREYIRRADAVVTVSGPIAELLQSGHRLAERPGLLLNVPATGAGAEAGDTPGDVRADAGLDRDTPLLVYSGGCAPQRGVATLIEAMPALPGVHVVLVASGADPHVPALREQAARLGCADRLHVLPFVPPRLVSAYLSTATAGVIPNLHRPNHELSLNTKYAEYLHARLPILVSDVKTMAAFTREHDIGEVFTAGDAGSLAAAAGRLIADRDRYAGVYRRDPGLLEELSWEGQATRLVRRYEQLTGLHAEAHPHPAPMEWSVDPIIPSNSA